MWTRSIEEVEQDGALTAFGAVLAITHALTAASWTGNRDLTRLLAPGEPALCWPVFEGCAALRIVPAPVWDALPWAFGLAGVGVAVLFARRRTSWAMAGLAALTVLGLAVLLQDYRLRLNQHLMHTLVGLAFLLVPDKRRTLQWLLVSFYFWAGTIKLNADWLTGAALGPGGVPGIPAALLPGATVYVVFLELALVFGLFGPRWLGVLTLVQLGLFHIASWGVVGFYYPLLMMGMLLIFPLSWARQPEGRRVTLPRPPPSVPGRPTFPALVVAGVSVLQIVPRLAPGDPALTSQGRLLALHMFDARVVCTAHMRVAYTDGRTAEVPIPTDTGPDRMRCDPVIHWGIARHTCDQHGVSDLDLYLSSRRSTDPTLHPVIALEDFCTVDPTFDLWSNPWINPG